MKKISVIFLGLLLSIATTNIKAQEKSEFQKFIEVTFEKNLSNLDQGNNVAPFLRAFTEELTWVSVIVSIDGRTTEKIQDKDGLRVALSRFNAHPSLAYKWEIIKYTQLTARENTRIATFETSVTLTSNGKTLQTGKNIVEVIATKRDGFYEINYLSVLQIAKQMYRGPCFVHITKEGKGIFNTITSFPDGTDYHTIKNTATFVGEGALKVVKIEDLDQKYYWNTAQNTVSMDSDGGRKIGSASQMDNVLLLVLKNMNSEKCTHMVRSYSTTKK